MKIGIVGYGYVGKAVAHSYSVHEILIHDPAYPDISCPLETMLSACTVLFVCVPTPVGHQGQCDASILQSVMAQLQGFSELIICKSTAPPAVYQSLEQLPGVKLAHVPEFLTQARANQDYLNPHKILVGCAPHLCADVAAVIAASDVNFDWVSIEYCSVIEASFFKYMANSMLAMKVSVCNEFHDLATALGLSWSEITRVAKTDTRLGNTHWAVPGPDGLRGYGGDCFPKDTVAMQSIAQQHNISMPVLQSAIRANGQYRDPPKVL